MPADGALSHREQRVGLQVPLGRRTFHPVDQGKVEVAAPGLPRAPRPPRRPAARTLAFLLKQPYRSRAHPVAEMADVSQRLADACVVVMVRAPTTTLAVKSEKIRQTRIIQRVREAVARPYSKVAISVPRVGEESQPQILMCAWCVGGRGVQEGVATIEELAGGGRRNWKLFMFKFWQHREAEVRCLRGNVLGGVGYSWRTAVYTSALNVNIMIVGEKVRRREHGCVSGVLSQLHGGARLIAPRLVRNKVKTSKHGRLWFRSWLFFYAALGPSPNPAVARNRERATERACNGAALREQRSAVRLTRGGDKYKRGEQVYQPRYTMNPQELQVMHRKAIHKKIVFVTVVHGAHLVQSSI